MNDLDKWIEKTGYLPNLKCLKFSEDYRLSIEEHNAEIITAKEYYKTSGKIPRLIVHMYNRYTNKITEFDLPSYIITGEIPKLH